MASDTADKFKRLKDAESEFQTCRRDPKIYDLLRDGCSGKRSDYESAMSAYRSQISDLKSSLSDVDSRIRRVNGSCTFELGRVGAPPPPIPEGVQNREMCGIYLRYKGSVPISMLMDTCAKSMPADQCRKCLGVP